MNLRLARPHRVNASRKKCLDSNFEVLEVKMASGTLGEGSVKKLDCLAPGWFDVSIFLILGVDCGSQFFLLCPAMACALWVKCVNRNLVVQAVEVVQDCQQRLVPGLCLVPI